MSAPVDHPPPWEWSEPFGRETVLSDANGEPVLTDGNDSTIVVASPYVRELVRSAPEMEALLRTVIADLRSFLMSDYSTTSDRGAEKAIATTGIPAAEALLARLDEARRG